MKSAAQLAYLVETRSRIFKRGDVWWVNLVKQRGVGTRDGDNKDQDLGTELFGKHMCVIIQVGDVVDAASIIVVPISSVKNDKQQTRKQLFSWIMLKEDQDGVLRDSYAECEQVRCVDKGRILGRAGRIPPNKMESIRQILWKLILRKD